LAAMLALSAASGDARSDPGDFGRGFDLQRLLDQGIRLFHQSTSSGSASQSSEPSLIELETMFPSRDPAFRDGLVRAGAPEFSHVGTMGAGAEADKGTTEESRPPRKDAFRPRLRLSLIARDWKGAISLAGRGTIPTDQIRLTRSSRMLVGRMSAGDGPV